MDGVLGAYDEVWGRNGVLEAKKMHCGGMKRCRRQYQEGYTQEDVWK